MSSKTISLLSILLSCSLFFGCASKEKTSPPPVNGMIPVLSQAQKISFFVSPWIIDIAPDGSVVAQYGSTAGDNVALPPGSVNFKELYLSIAQNAEAANRDGEHPVSVVVFSSSPSRTGNQGCLNRAQASPETSHDAQ